MKVALTLVFLMTTTGCATSYKPHGLGGGYSEVQLNEKMYRVSFAGNGYTPKERTRSYLLRRCAELTKERGFTHFDMVTGEVDNTRVAAYSTPATYTVSQSYGNSRTVQQTGGGVNVVEFPASETTILLTNEPQPTSFSADIILKQFSPK